MTRGVEVCLKNREILTALGWARNLRRILAVFEGHGRACLRINCVIDVEERARLLDADETTSWREGLSAGLFC